MRLRVLVVGVVAGVLLGCESPVEAIDTTVTMTADWQPPAGPFTIGAEVPGRPTVVITDSRGAPRRGVVVAFLPLVPPETVFPSVDTTDADGRAVMPGPWILGTRVGTNRLLVYVPSGQTNDPVTFAVQVQAGSATLFDASIGSDTAAIRGDTLTVTLNVRDASGNPVSPSAPVVLASSDTTVARVLPGLRVLLVGAGRSMLRVSAGTLRDSMNVLVGAGAPTIQRSSFPFSTGSNLRIGTDGVIYAASNTVRIRRFSIGALDSMPSFLEAVPLRDVEIRPGTSELWSLTNRLVVRSSASGDSLAGVGATGQRVTSAADGSFLLVTGGYSAPVMVAPGPNPVVSALPSAPPFSGSLEETVGVAIGAGDTVAYVGSSANATLYRLRLPSGAPTANRAFFTAPTGVVFNHVSPRVYVAVPFAGVFSLNHISLAPERAVPLSGGAYDVALTNDARYVLAAGNDAVRILDALTLTQYASLSVTGAVRIAMDPVTADAWVLSNTSAVLTRLTVTPP